MVAPAFPDSGDDEMPSAEVSLDGLDGDQTLDLASPIALADDGDGELASEDDLGQIYQVIPAGQITAGTTGISVDGPLETGTAAEIRESMTTIFTTSPAVSTGDIEPPASSEVSPTLRLDSTPEATPDDLIVQQAIRLGMRNVRFAEFLLAQKDREPADLFKMMAHRGDLDTFLKPEPLRALIDDYSELHQWYDLHETLAIYSDLIDFLNQTSFLNWGRDYEQPDILNQLRKVYRRMASYLALVPALLAKVPDDGDRAKHLTVHERCILRLFEEIPPFLGCDPRMPTPKGRQRYECITSIVGSELKGGRSSRHDEIGRTLKVDAKGTIVVENGEDLILHYAVGVPIIAAPNARVWLGTPSSHCRVLAAHQSQIVDLAPRANKNKIIRQAT